MADSIVYQGLTFERTGSGKWLVSTNFGQATGATPAEAILVAADSIAYKNQNSETIQAYAARIKEIGLDPATNSGVNAAYTAGDTPTPPQDTASTQLTNDTPGGTPAATELSPTEEKNLDAAPASIEPSAPVEANNKVETVTEASDKVETVTDPVTGRTYKVAPAGSTADFSLEVAQKPDTVSAEPIPNVLHDYPSYTYNLSLHLLTREEFAAVLEKPMDYVPKRVLIASAGRYNNTPGPTQFIRAPYFDDDFYFEDLTLDTTIAPTDSARNSNVVKFSMTVVEPYGFTLIEKIKQLNDDIKSPNYLDMPYLIQIDFFGINNAGEIIGQIPGATRRIPVQLKSMQGKVTNKGTEYKIDGVAYNHVAFDISVVTTPVNFEIVARTVDEFFKSNDLIGGQSGDTAQRESASAPLYSSSSGQLVGPDGQLTSLNQINSSLVSGQTLRQLGLVRSYGTAINNYFKRTASANKIGSPDVYKFEFHPAIGNSIFTDPGVVNPKDTSMADAEKVGTIKKSALGYNMKDYDPNLRIFQINAGTHIDRVISWVVRNSKWFQDQLVIPDGETPDSYKAKKEANKDKPLQWIKIIPSIKLLDFDNRRGIWSREITYYVIPYKMNNQRLDVAPQGRAGDPVKVYNYLYTGKNVDIIDLDIQFNFLYYNALTVYRDSVTGTEAPNRVTEEYNTANPDNYYQDSLNPNNDSTIMPLMFKPQVLDARTRASGGSVTAKQTAAADVEANINTSENADMIIVKMTILGDPSFIKQDDAFFAPQYDSDGLRIKTGSDPRLLPDGSLTMDNGEVVVQLNINTIGDMDETTSLGKPSPAKSLFSGKYYVKTISNEFKGGRFVQVLDLVRYPRQGKSDSNQQPKTDNRTGSDIPMAAASATGSANPPISAPNTTTGNTPALEDNATGQSAQESAPTTVAEDTGAAATDTQTKQELSEVRDNGPTQTINDQNQPVATPSPQPPSAEKLALQQEYAALQNQNVSIRNASAEADRRVDTFQNEIEIVQGNIERARAKLANPEFAAAAQQSIESNQQRLATLQNSLSAAKQTQASAQSALDAALAKENELKQKVNQAV